MGSTRCNTGSTVYRSLCSRVSVLSSNPLRVQRSAHSGCFFFIFRNVHDDHWRHTTTSPYSYAYECHTVNHDHHTATVGINQKYVPIYNGHTVTWVYMLYTIYSAWKSVQTTNTHLVSLSLKVLLYSLSRLGDGPPSTSHHWSYACVCTGITKLASIIIPWYACAARDSVVVWSVCSSFVRSFCLLVCLGAQSAFVALQLVHG